MGAAVPKAEGPVMRCDAQDLQQGCPRVRPPCLFFIHVTHLCVHMYILPHLWSLTPMCPCSDPCPPAGCPLCRDWTLHLHHQGGIFPMPQGHTLHCLACQGQADLWQQHVHFPLFSPWAGLPGSKPDVISKLEQWEDPWIVERGSGE